MTKKEILESLQGALDSWKAQILIMQNMIDDEFAKERYGSSDADQNEYLNQLAVRALLNKDEFKVIDVTLDKNGEASVDFEDLIK